MTEPRLGRARGAEGTELGWRLWEAPAPRATALIVHGLGEHSGRYQEVAENLVGGGISAFSFDLRGHGLSEGPRGDISAFPRFLEDLLVMEGVLSQEVPGRLPRFLLGHSMGGLIALSRVSTLGEGFSGAIFSAPWLRVPRPRWMRRLAGGLGWLFPRMPLPNGLGSQRLTRDPVVAEAWQNDPLIHARVTGGLYREAERVQRELLDRSIRPGIPLLFLLAGADRVVDTGVSRAFAEGIVGEDVTIEILEDREHEPFNDLGREEVYRMVVNWVGDVVSRLA